MDPMDYPERTGSEMLVELHVYLMPSDLWREHLHSAINQIIGDTISAGFIRVDPDALLFTLKDEITKQLGFDIVPRSFVFLRCIGRCFTQVKPKQERELKAKHFMPPHTYSPELFVLDANAARLTPSSYDMDDDLERQRLAELRRRKEEEERMRRLLEDELGRQRIEIIESPPLRPNTYDERYRMLKELERYRMEREEMERLRDELVKRAKMLEAKQYNRKNQARDIWKKKFFDEKKKTAPVEDQSNKLHRDLEAEHRKIIGQLEALKDNKENAKRTPGDNRNLDQLNMRLQATKYEHSIEELHTRLQSVKMKLTAEMRLRYQSECELQALRADLAQRKVNVMMTRTQAYQAVGNVAHESLTARSLPAPTPRLQSLY